MLSIKRSKVRDTGSLESTQVVKKARAKGMTIAYIPPPKSVSILTNRCLKVR
jgi:hypothetical protein